MKLPVLLSLALAAITLFPALARQGKPLPTSVLVQQLKKYQFPAGDLCSMTTFSNNTAVTYGDFKLPIPAFLAYEKLALMMLNVGLSDSREYPASNMGQGYHLMHYSGPESAFGVNIYMSELDRKNTEICIFTID